MEESIYNFRGVCCSFSLYFISHRNFCKQTDSVDHDQMPQSVTSDLGPHGLPRSHIWDARHIWVNIMTNTCKFSLSAKIEINTKAFYSF